MTRLWAPPKPGVHDAVGRDADHAGGVREALIIFAVAPLVCALVPGVAVLIAARAVQGLGGTVMTTSTTALLSGAYQGRALGTAFGV
ncbi:hypothetical protein [Streptomyces sp. NPDC002785]|uniref:hypothetical protein n=1 Tax=Streptomyces sp. NPDC002785 TaxID=3154543 RepID=UPI0033200187